MFFLALMVFPIFSFLLAFPSGCTQMNTMFINQTKARRLHLSEMFQCAINVEVKDDGLNNYLEDWLKIWVAGHLLQKVCLSTAEVELRGLFLKQPPGGFLWAILEPHFETTAPGWLHYNAKEPDLCRGCLLSDGSG